MKAPIEVTEFGAPAARVSLAQWGTELTATVRALATSGCGITRIIAYRDQDPITAAMGPVLIRTMAGAAGLDHPTVRGAGHFLQEDAGERFGAIIADFAAT